MLYRKENWGIFFEAKNHTVGFLAFATILLTLAGAALLTSAFLGWGLFAILGQALFVVLVFSGVTLILITAIAQDLRFGKGSRQRS